MAVSLPTTNKIRILIVEDEADVAAFIVEALQQQGYDTTLVGDGPSALRYVISDTYDLIVLDVALPGLDGFEVMKLAREHVKTPIIMLTARTRLKDRLQGLELGADDYINKPFELSEFLARVKALLRRSAFARGVLEVGDLVLDPVGRRARRGNRNLYFSNTEFALIEYLASRAGEVVSKKEILLKVWEEDEHRDPNLVEVYVGYLRQKLETNGQARMIHTIRGAGYMLAAGVAQEATP